MSGRTFNGDTSVLTEQVTLKKVVDGILDGSVIQSLVFSKAKPFSGVTQGIPLKYQKNTQMGSYSGMGNFGSTVENNTVRMYWKPTSMYASATIPSMDEAINKTKSIVDLKRYKLESIKDDYLDLCADKFYGSGTGNDPDGLGNIVDDGSVAADYTGLARATYSALNADVDTSVGSISLSTLGQSIDEATVGSHDPNLILTTKTIWRAIEDLLFPSVMATYGAAGSKRGKVNRLGDVGSGQTLTGLAGYTAIFYRGIPIVKDEKCPSGYIYYLNTDKLYWAGLAHPLYGTVDLGGGIIEGVDNEAPANHGIAFTGWMRPTLQDGETCQIIQYGQLVCESPRHNSVDQGCQA